MSSVDSAFDVVIAPNGAMRFVYRDHLQWFYALGSVDIRRVSHVEPCEGLRWIADLGPVNGPVLGPFNTRDEALQAEFEWIGSNWDKIGGPNA